MKLQQNEKTVLTELISFSVPLILSGILQQLYGWVDAFIVGNVEGELALGAIGSIGSVQNFYLLAVTGFTVGLAVLAGQKFGSGELPFLRQLLSTFSVLMGGCFAVLAGMGLLLADGILGLLDTPADIFAMAGLYLRIVLCGIPFLAVYNVYSAVLRGMGDSKAPFYAILVSSGVNVVLDILLVAVFRWGIAGAAGATLFSQIAMTLFLVAYAWRKHPALRGEKADRREVLTKGFRLGLPPMLQSCITAIGNMVLQGFMNSFGTATVVAITSAYRIDTVAMLPLINLGSAISTLTAQSCGMGDRQRVRMVRSAGLELMVPVAVGMTLLVIPMGTRLIALFGAGQEAVQIGHDFFVRLASFYVVFGLYGAARGYLEGTGDVVYSSAVGIFTLAVRIAGSYALVGFFGNMVIAYAEAIAWMTGCALLFARMLSPRHRLPGAKTE